MVSFEAGDETRTRYLHLGKVALYRMSYTRITQLIILPRLEMSRPILHVLSLFFLFFSIHINPLLRQRAAACMMILLKTLKDAKGMGESE